MNFSEKVKTARTAKNMSQKELATATGISERTIQNYEMGVRLPKKRETYMKLAGALGISPDVLMDEDAAFIITASERYGGRGRKQAEALADQMRTAVAAAGGALDDDDIDFLRDAMMQTFDDAKRYNQRFRNKRYKEDN